MPMDANCTLVIMAKAPRPGAVKTRLASSMPDEQIAGLYRCLLEDTLALAQSLDGVEAAIMCPPADVEELARIAGARVRVLAQTGKGLAAALGEVFGTLTPAGERRVIAFNSDSPHLPAPALLAAFETLSASDLVIGPTDDGGYYLVGAARSHPDLFSADSMGTGSALDALLARARRLALSVRFTQAFYDIDVPADLNRLADDLRFAPERAPRTANWLAARQDA